MISIIVPVYNAENTIERCIESISKQTYENIEIIIVNDGSQDSSLDICKKMAAADTRIKMVDKMNGGASSARNAGLDIITGAYFQFVDSDDYLGEDFCSLMLSIALREDCDIVISGFSYCSDKCTIPNPIGINQGAISSRYFAEKFPMLYCSAHIASPWNKLFSSTLKKLRFNEAVEMGEDMIFCINAICRVSKIGIADTIGYYYCVGNIHSVTSSSVPKDNKSLILYCATIRDFLHQYLSSDVAGQIIAEVCVTSLLNDLLRIASYKKLSFSDRLYIMKEFVYDNPLILHGLPSNRNRYRFFPTNWKRRLLLFLAERGYLRAFIHICRIVNSLRKLRGFG